MYVASEESSSGKLVHDEEREGEMEVHEKEESNYGAWRSRLSVCAKLDLG